MHDAEVDVSKVEPSLRLRAPPGLQSLCFLAQPGITPVEGRQVASDGELPLDLDAE